jgi:hypothetical protein
MRKLHTAIMIIDVMNSEKPWITAVAWCVNMKSSEAHKRIDQYRGILGAVSRSDDAPLIVLYDGEVESFVVTKRWRRQGKRRRVFGSKREGDGKDIVPTKLEQWWAVTGIVQSKPNFRRTRERAWLQPLEHRSRGELHVMNPWAGAEFARHLSEAWSALADGMSAQAVTVIDQAHDWHESRYGEPDPRQVLPVRDALAAQCGERSVAAPICS